MRLFLISFLFWQFLSELSATCHSYMKRLRDTKSQNWLAAMSLNVFIFTACTAGAEQVRFNRDFAALENFVKPVERPFRQEVCLNGSWQFQSVTVPAGYKRDQGAPPELPPPTNAWEATPIKIPSPWNANTYGCGRNVGLGTEHPYWPDSVLVPRYPASWDGAVMGSLLPTFR